ncbi:hypothetical protein [Magnetospira sp. QH-2]|uniref:hypothetical protein n=1 Tax=Magnetospira sp. (strain QH-2) TaxID=1288970 RepID=UPI0003E819A1|nr:hypothetical protein [Magnetospira sp. QH-2]CCQ75422.1 exported protein of unknown function [Magnetospira sp. QH-2]
MMPDPALVAQATGAALAVTGGLLAAAVWRWSENKARRRRVARALLADMEQSLNVFISLVETLEKTPADQTFPARLAQPVSSHMVAALGSDLGALSKDAVRHAVAFDGTIRAFERAIALFPDQNAIPRKPLFTHSLWTLSMLRENFLLVARDAYSFADYPEPTRFILKRSQKLMARYADIIQRS